MINTNKQLVLLKNTPFLCEQFEFGKYILLCNHHPPIHVTAAIPVETDNIYFTLNIPHRSPFSESDSYPEPQATDTLFSQCRLILHILEIYVSRIMAYVFSYVCLLSLGLIFLVFIHVLHIVVYSVFIDE